MYPGVHEQIIWSQTFANSVPLHCQSDSHIPPMFTISEKSYKRKFNTTNISIPNIIENAFKEI